MGHVPALTGDPVWELITWRLVPNLGQGLRGPGNCCIAEALCLIGIQLFVQDSRPVFAENGIASCHRCQ
jgi:hypothetical protein